jgi:hypothetical protein
MRLVISKFGLEGIGAVIQLEQMIFNEGYACSWNEESECLFMAEYHVSKERIDLIMEYCLEHGIFDRRLLDERKILTSRDIQLEWLKICEICRRKNCEIAEDLDLTTEKSESEKWLFGETQGNMQSKSPDFQKPSGKTPSNYEQLPSFSEKYGEAAELLSQRKEKREIKEIEELGKASVSESSNPEEQHNAEFAKKIISDLAKWKKRIR